MRKQYSSNESTRLINENAQNSRYAQIVLREHSAIIVPDTCCVSKAAKTAALYEAEALCLTQECRHARIVYGTPSGNAGRYGVDSIYPRLRWRLTQRTMAKRTRRVCEAPVRSNACYVRVRC